MDIIFRSCDPKSDEKMISFLVKNGFNKIMIWDISPESREKIEAFCLDKDSDIEVMCKYDEIRDCDTAIFSSGLFYADDSGSSLIRVQAIKKSGKKVALFADIGSKTDEDIVINYGGYFDYILISLENWKIIPLENIISRLKGKTQIYAEPATLQDISAFHSTLEIGVDGIIIHEGFREDIEEIIELCKKTTPHLSLSTAEIISVEYAGEGDRVCIDTTSILEHGEGMLVGSLSNHLFLIHSESIENDFVNSRPFRVNAGAVHAYVLDEHGNTKYLSEISSGTRLLAVNYRGDTRIVTVGRVKIERRPMLLIKAKYASNDISEIASTIVQNAETIRFVSPEGNPVSVADLRKRDKILILRQKGGTHFGVRVSESIIEK